MEAKKISVKEFVDIYNKLENKQKAMEAAGIVKYIPYEIKFSTAMNVIKDNFQIVDNMILKNTPMLYVLNRMCMVKLYCQNIVIDDNNALSDYDMLNSHGLIDEIIKYIGVDVQEFDTVFNMTFDDFTYNISSPQAYVNRIINNIVNMTEGKLESLIETLKDTDIKSLLEEMNKTKE